jgi:peptidoglycan/xylan/chitin deacetylase (PgdA/CDA1 family)
VARRPTTARRAGAGGAAATAPLPNREPVMTKTPLLVASTLCLAMLGLDAQAPLRRVSITIDDGPVVGEMSDLGNFQRISNGLIGSFQVEKVPVTIFINERQLNVSGQRDARAAVVEQWLNAGFDVGNHTYSHRSANNVSLEEFQDDIVKGEVIMRPLLQQRGRPLVWLRYPYLHSGTTAEIHQAIVDFLDRRKYRVAPVTVDYADYTFAGAYVRELRLGNIDVAEKIRLAYLDQVDVGFAYAERASIELFGREIPQILLIHCNELNAVSLRDSIGRMRKRGYSFVSLEEAMQDAAYERPDTFAGAGGSWLSRTANAMGQTLTPETAAARPVVPQWITGQP